LGIVGSSGCGKSTLLNILAGLDKQDSGTIIKNNLKIAYMLQIDALLPWLNVLDNALLGLKIKHELNNDNINYVKNLISKFGLEDFINKYPNNLSGGMRQRVALIRTLALKPDIILLDEPLSALDYVTRLTITDEIYNILKELNISTILISHDIAECTSFCDNIIVLSKRPSIIKKIYHINLKNKNIPSINRQDELFNYYYDLIWKELDKNVS
jgi:NitT/TauT family transport system ATP-binding protein